MLKPGPDHPIDITPVSGRVVVTLDGEEVANSANALALQESTYPVAYYIPMADLVRDRFARTDHTTHCPYKGDANYFSVAGADGSVRANSVWFYEAPYEPVAQIKDHVSFYADKFDIRVES